MGKRERAPAGAATTAVVGKIDSAPAGAVTAGAVGTYREESCWSRHYCGSGENGEKVPARAGTTAVVKKQLGGDSYGGVGAVGKGRGGGRGSCWSKHCCGSEKIEGGRGGGRGSCWSKHCCGSEEIEGGGGVKERGWRERLPAGASTAAAVRKFRKRSCGSRHCWGSEEIRVALLRGAFTTAVVRKYR